MFPEIKRKYHKFRSETIILPWSIIKTHFMTLKKLAQKFLLRNHLYSMIFSLVFKKIRETKVYKRV